MYRFKKYLFYSSHEIQKLKYKIGYEDEIKIFTDEFVWNNANNFSIIYRDNIIPLRIYFLTKDINKEDKDKKIKNIFIIIKKYIK